MDYVYRKRVTIERELSPVQHQHQNAAWNKMVATRALDTESGSFRFQDPKHIEHMSNLYSKGQDQVPDPKSLKITDF